MAGSTVGYTNGTGTAAQFYGPTGIDIDSAGNLYVADAGNHVIRKITPAGVVTTFAGSTPGLANGFGTAARFYYPWDVEVHGNVLLVSDYGNHRIRNVDLTTAAVNTVSGVGSPAGGTGGMVDGSRAVSQFSFPTGISAGTGGTLYVADRNNHRIRTVNLATGEAGTLAGSVEGLRNGTGEDALFNSPNDVAHVDGYVYVADTLNHRIRRINATTGLVTTTSGLSWGGVVEGGFVDGDTMTARLNQPFGLTAAPGGLYVTDALNYAIRWFDTTSNNLSTVVGTGHPGATDSTTGYNAPEVVYTGPDPSYLDTNTTPGAAYRYTLTATNSAGTSPTAGPITAHP